MTTGLDTRIVSALRETAAATATAPELLATIIRRANRRARQRRRITLAGAAVTGVALCTGTAYAVIDQLSPDQTATVEQHPSCGLTAETARLVATAELNGRTVDYWTVDGDDHFGDFVFDRQGLGGGGGCAEQTRQAAHPTLPWANYLTETASDTGLFMIYGQAPPETATVEVIMSNGTVRATPEEDGFFLAVAELPDYGDDRLERVDALASDGTVIASGRY